MAEKNIEIMYDKEQDIFSLFEKGEKSKFSFEISLPKGDFVLDFGFNGKIIGLEWFNASSYFPDLKEIDPKNLEAKMSVQYGVNWAEVHFEISSPELKKSISNSIISPYNQKLVMGS